MNLRKLSLVFVSVLSVLILSAAAFIPTDNSVFIRAWEKAFPGTKPLTEQDINTQIAAKDYGEAVLWAAANPQPEPGPSTGWTDLPVAADAILIHVSSSLGNDAGDGSEAKPYKSFEVGKAKLRDAKPDRLLLLAGDTFSGNMVRWEASGRSANEPVVLGVYGQGERPILRMGIVTFGNTLLHDVAIVGIEFSNAGLQWRQPGSNVLVEDCRIVGGGDGLDFSVADPGVTNVKIRRSIVMETAAPPIEGHVQGGYFYGLHNFLLEECVFDHNGFPADIFRHGCYVQNGNTGVVVRGCLIAHSSSHGMQLRCGGTVEDSLFYENPINLQVGGGNDPEDTGVTANIVNNVFFGGGDIGPNDPRGFGVFFSNISQGQMTGNLILDGTGGLRVPLSVDGSPAGDNDDGRGGCHIQITKNIRRNWPCIQHPDAVLPGYLRKGTDAELAGTIVQDVQERTDLVGVDVSLDKYMPNFIVRSRNRLRGQWEEAVSASAYNTWARTRLGVSP